MVDALQWLILYSGSYYTAVDAVQWLGSKVYGLPIHDFFCACQPVFLILYCTLRVTFQELSVSV